MRKWLKSIGIVIFIPIAFFLLVAGLLLIPSVQNAAVRKAMDYVSTSTGWDIRFDQLRLSFPLNLSVCHAVVKDEANDLSAQLDKLTVGIRFKPLLKGRISVKGLLLESLNLDTGDFIEGVIIKGKVEKAYLIADSINLKEEQAWVNQLILSDADIYFYLCDTTVAETATTALNWRIMLKSIEFSNISFDCRMPCDSVFVKVQLDRAVLSDGLVDLCANLYCMQSCSAHIRTLFYGTDLNEPVSSGFDYSHIALTELTFMSDSLYYHNGAIGAAIRAFSGIERSEIVVKSLTGHIEMDSQHLNIPDVLFETPISSIQLQAFIPWSALDDRNPEGQLLLHAKARLHKHDILQLTGYQTDDFPAWVPDTAFLIEAVAGGNLKELTLQKFDGELSGAFNFHATGSALSLTDDHLRSGRVDFSVITQNMGFIVDMFPATWQQRIQIPDSMSLNGFLTVEKDVYATRIKWEEDAGIIRFSGNYNTSTENYIASLRIDSLEPVHFLPDDSILWLSASIRAQGRGTDLYHYATLMDIEGRINELRYGNYTFKDDITFSANLNNHQLKASLESRYPLLKGSVAVDGDILHEWIRGMITVDVDSLDLYGLKLTDSPLSMSFQAFSEFETDLDYTHTLDLTLGNWCLSFDNQTIEPKMLTFAFRSDADTTSASLNAGDLHITLSGNTSLGLLAGQLALLSNKTEEQIKSDSAFHVESLRPYFPEMSLLVKAERDNPVYHFLQEYNTFFDAFRLDATISPDEGLKVYGSILALVRDTLKIDTIRFSAWQDTVGLFYAAGITKNRFRNQEAFQLDASGFIRNNEADILASYTNSSGKKGLYLGVNAKKMSDGFNFHFYPAQPVLAFIPFTINENNYFNFKNRNEMEADLRLEGNAQSSIWIHSTHQDSVMSEMLVETNQINLQEITSGFEGLPALRGLLNISFKYEPEDNTFMVFADGNIDDFYYEDGRIGELLLNATYVPVDKGAHQVDMHAFHDMSEIASLSIVYQEGKEENKINGFLAVDRFPIDIVNAMIPDRTVQLDGRLNGKFDITGTDLSPVISGELRLDKGTAYIRPTATTLNFDGQPVRMAKNRISFNQFTIHAQNEQPLIINGFIDATNTSNPTVDLSMTASNMQLLESRRMPESIAFGRLYVNFNSTLNGSLNALRMRGNLHILGNTNMTYVLSEENLEVQDNFTNLVTFTYLADTLPRRIGPRTGIARNAATVGTDVLMNINIDPVVRLRIDLDDAQSNYIDLRGGGNLSMQYTTQGDIRMNGRYTLSDGTIRYAIPVIPLTDFSIRNGSFVDWSGDPFNPFLNISAYTRARSSVNFGGQSRMVNFNAGIQLQDNLDDVSIQFLLEAPTDAVVQNQLSSMGAEARSMQAISLLVTGVYLSSEGMGNYNMNVSAALSNLLQREIKQILGNLMGDIPVSFDVNTYDGTEGMGRRIDYIGRFYKDFFNERFNTTLGLRYSTQDPVYGNKFMPDDISFGYRLDTDGSRAIQLFRSKEYENTFENEIAKYGASFTIRRKIKRLNDLFTIRKRITTPINEDDDEADK